MVRPVALIPVLNCATHLGKVVEGTRAHVPDVLVIDDGSTDGSAEIARAAGARVVVHPHNLGKGPAVRSGLAVLLGEPFTHVVMLDGDGQHDPDDIPAMLAATEEAELVLGTRLYRPDAIPANRYWTNYIGTRALQLMSGYPLEDSQCGFRVVASSMLRRMGLAGGRFSIDTEIFVRAGKLGARFVHVPIKVIYDHGGGSHYRALPDTLHIIFSCVRFKADEADLRRDPGPEGWRAAHPAPPVLAPLESSS
jgi:glycosyltransferase involved in cell wall biosynthesis